LPDPNDTLPDAKIRIGERLLTEGSGGVYDHVNPATGKVQATIPLAGQKEVDEAADVAQKAFEEWSRWKPADRLEVLFKLSGLLEENAYELGRLTARDVGSAMSLASRGWSQAKAWNSYYAGWTDKIDGQVTKSFNRDGEFSYTQLEPYGVVGIINTWNGPVIGMGMKVSPAIAAGNTVLVKPSEMTPFSTQLYGDLVVEAGIPPGVVNILHGTGEAGEAIVKNRLVKKVSFTGGPTVARKILEGCARLIKPAVLELGGKSANIVFPDANLDVVCPWSVQFSIGLLSGQGCSLPTRMLVHEDVYDEVVERVVIEAQKLVQGDPFDPAVTMGPVVNQAALDRILGIIETARKEGSGRLLTGGNRLGGELADGYYIEPTVFADVDPGSSLAQEEIFGPVLAITKFSSEDEAASIANSTEYGLAAWLQTADASRVHRVAERLHAGSVWANGAAPIQPNTPFGGVGLSGYGKEGGRAGLDEFVRAKTIALGTFV
jgi:aldehyde dehydrogenase (NAD+)